MGKNGKYAFHKVIGAEIFELMVQATTAISMAGFLDWSTLRGYFALIAANCIIFGFCMLLPEQRIKPSAFVAFDVVFGEHRACEAVMPLRKRHCSPGTNLPLH